ncbi:WD40/YVTN/BNR-like repeat-containing protein [Oleiharenicola lentus]|uniref:WD40/YVTN/BNR-like repeat-containing protein n=1 Tax=Oleiharenicola lentus TaxID=2508720 RepID=UPI003F670BB4
MVPGFAGPICPLAQDHVVLGESPSPKDTPLYSPTILRLESGRLLAAYTQAGKGEKHPSGEFIFTSDDGGKTWTKRAEAKPQQGRLFVAGKAIYYLATGAGLPILRSDDEGVTWSAPVLLTSKDKVWQQTPANVWHANGNVYLAFERRFREIEAWGPSEKALVLLRAKADADLTKPAAWTFSSELVFADVVPGVRENDVKLPFLGIPFLNRIIQIARPCPPRRAARCRRSVGSNRRWRR